MGVNLSARQLNQPQFSSKVARIAQEAGLKLEDLELELTEGAILDNAEVAEKILTELKALGIKLALDDFGTGYSSLTYLKKFPFDRLKIDQSFIRNLTNDSGSSAITLSTIQMAHRLALDVIAEGVEHEGELAFLREHSCDEMQGYLFSRPLPVLDFEKLYSSKRRLQFI